MLPKTLRFGELFCGPGGMSLGLKLAAKRSRVAVQHAWAVDIDPNATSTYKRNFPDADVRTGDVRQLRFSELRPVDALAFGFPCNDFSVVGEHRGTDGEYGPLYLHCVDAVRHFSPLFFVAENVGGIRSANSGRAFESILDSFSALGYAVTPHFFRFEYYGVPQRRHRVLLVGIREDLGVKFRVPAPTRSMRTSREAIEDPPIEPDAPNHEFTQQSATVVKRLLALRPGENAFSDSLPRELQLNVRGARISQIYRRLDPNQPAYTVTGSGGGGTHVYHWSEPRALTNRERARLQSFPDSFVFEGRKEAVRRQIGMAVPPEGAAAVFSAIFQCLLGKQYPSVPASLGSKYGALVAQLELA